MAQIKPSNQTLKQRGKKFIEFRILSLQTYYNGESYIYYGIVSPVITTLVILLAIFIIVTIIRGNFRSSTYVQMVAIAIANCLTGLGPLALTICLRLLGDETDYLQLPWCYTFQWLQRVFPEVFHLSSLHLTVGMAIERFIVVWFPTKVKQLCTTRHGITLSCVIFVFSVCSQFDLFLTDVYDPISFFSPKTNTTVETCYIREKTRSSLEAVLRKSFLVFLPCLLLAVFTILLLYKISKVKKWRKSNSSATIRSIDRLNVTVVIILIVVMVSETVYSTILLYNRFNFTKAQTVTLAAGHITFQITSMVNLLILICLSKDFRRKYRETFVCFKIPSTALATTSGELRCTERL